MSVPERTRCPKRPARRTRTARTPRLRALLASLALHSGILAAGLGLSLPGRGELAPMAIVLALERAEPAASGPEPPSEPWIEIVVPVLPPVPLTELPVEELPLPPIIDVLEEELVEQADDVSLAAWLEPVLVREAEEELIEAPVAVPTPKPAPEPTPLAGRNLPPRYPALAARQGVEGVVHVELHVDREGRVTVCKLAASSGDRRLDQAALHALGRWRFRNGPGVTRIPVVFRITGSQQTSAR